ncbi:MAG: RNA methyltransferase [Candidatus Aminicenantales bacterium]
MPTARRTERVKRLLSLRQPDLRVVLEGVAIAHNASAVIRTCDAAGILHLDLVSPNPELLGINKAISTRAEKWLDVHIHKSLESCLLPLKEKGFQVAVTHLGEEAVEYADFDYTPPLTIVFGSESEGVSPQALNLADHRIRIPMLGMVQSLNLSVSVGVILFEALKQRRARGFLDRRQLSDGEFERYLRKWLDADGETEIPESG